MATRFASQPREARKVIDRLGIQLVKYEVMYGKRVQMLKPLADIFEELNKKGATQEDIYKIFGRIGASGAVMLLNNYDKLRELTIENRASHGISGELAQVKQETTKGLWYQMTSQLSETFMQGYELLEPKIRGVLKNFLAKFKAPEFARGLASLGNALLDIFSILGNIAAWFGRNFSWLEPLIFTGLVSTKLFKLAGAVTNLGVALGFLGKQSAAASGLQLLTSLTGIGGKGLTKALSFAQKRVLVSELTALGVSGKGAMAKALSKAGLLRGVSGMAVRGTASGLFATQVATGSGLVGAGASIGALGTSAVIATAGIAALVGAVGWLGYKMWQLKDAKDAIQEDLNSKEKYRYKSLDDLYEQMEETRKKAEETKSAVNGISGETLLKDVTSQPSGIFSMRWYGAVTNYILSKELKLLGIDLPTYTLEDSRKDNLTESIQTYAESNIQPNLDSVYADLGRMKDPLQVQAFIQDFRKKYGLSENLIDPNLMDAKENWFYKLFLPDQKLTIDQAQRTAPYIKYYNDNLLPSIKAAAEGYLDGISSYDGAADLIKKNGFDLETFSKFGFKRSNDGNWAQEELSKNATDEQRKKAYSNYSTVRESLINAATNLRKKMGGSAQIVANIMEKAGISPALYSNEPLTDDSDPFNRPNINSDADDGGAGGNYSGTGKLSSAAPKQVIVNIANLLSVDTIDLMKTKEGQTEEIQNVKDMMAQALIDVVHDFDASWNS